MEADLHADVEADSCSAQKALLRNSRSHFFEELRRPFVKPYNEWYAPRNYS